MRKVFLSFIAVLLWTGIFAESVDVSSARRVAESFLAGIEAKNIGQLNDITSTTPFREFYVFSIGDEGFILVSADDCVLPILGYSLTNKFSVKNMPKNVKAVLEGYDEQIRFYKEQANTATLRTSDGGVSENDIVAEQWKMLLSGTAPEPDYTTSVAPLLTTTWNQSPYYNNMCPYDENYYENTVTGCVATATAQIMKYWNHPTTGYGSHSYNHSAYGTLSANFGTTTYDWNNMPTALSTNSTTAELNAVATLMYHVGVAIEMDYGVSATGGSGANNYSVLGEVNASSQHALVEYFKYSPDMQVLSKAEYSDADWDAVLMAELDQNRPILYSGRDLSGGHSYVCDGYNQEGMFHINWGWGGYCDGYYEMGALNPAPGGTGGNATYTFNLKNVVVLGIRPNTDWNTSTVVTATANSASYGNVTGAGTYTFGDIVEIKAMPVDGYRFKQWNDGSKYNPRKFVATGGNYSYTAIFEPLQGDTLGYSANTCLSAYNVDDWGIKLPGILFPNGDTLMAVQFYVYEEGTYDLTVYTGGSSIEQAVYTSTYVATESGSWQTIPLTTPAIVAPNQSVWLTLHCTDVAYPGAVSYYTGGYNSFLVGESFTAYTNTNSFMIRGIFGEYTEEDNDTDTDSEDCIVINNDTVSYCGDNLFETSVGVGVADTALQWGILLPGNSIENRNTVESVLLYVPVTGNYIMKIYQGDPATLIHRQQYTATTTGWTNIMLPAELPLDNSQNLLITFSSPDVDYPAAACNSVGCSNSDWFSLGDGWGHIGDQNLNYSWLIKCVMKESDTISYCGNRPYIGRLTYEVSDSNFVWGINLPSNTLTNRDVLESVQLFVPTLGTYVLKVYSTNTSSIHDSTLVYRQEYTATELSWNTIVLDDMLVIDKTKDLYVMFSIISNTPVTPLAVCDYAGNVYSSLYYEDDAWYYTNNFSWLIKCVTKKSYPSEDGCITIQDDVVSYCADNPFTQNIGAGVADTAFQWGILLPGNSIENRNTVESVLLYVPVTGNYIMKIYQGDPATLIHRQQYTATTTGWTNIMLPAELPLDNSQNLLITFSSPDVDYPAAACNSVGCSNSDWFSLGDGWGHIGDQNLNYSWLIKCVMKESDTISYCGNRPYIGRLTYEVSDSNFVWGINLPSNTLTNRDVLESVQLFVPTLGTYVLKVYSTNTSSIHDSTLVYRQEYTATELSWNTIVLDDMLVIDKTKDLYVMFSIISNTPVTPLAVCDYAGNVYSSLYYEDDAWYYTDNFSWLIKCITRKVCPITIECLGNGQGIVSLSASPLNNVCGQTYYLRNGDTATYIFTPSVGSTLAGVMLNSTDYMNNLQPLGQGAYSLSFVVTDTTILQSIFAINEYQLSVSLADAAMGAVTGAGTYHHGDTVAITAVPNQETFFVNWNDGDTNNPRIIVIDRDTAFTATFGYYPIYNTILDTICSNEIYTDNGFNTAVEGTYTDTIHTAIGRDSIVTLVLTVIPTSTGVDVQEACNSYTWIDGVTYTESTNTPTYTITAANGCDSVVTLHLTINLSVYDTIVDYAETEYTWNDTTYTESGTYQYVGVTADGCDSIVTLILTIGDVGIDGADVLESLTFYPNPTTGNITFNRSDILKVEVLDAVGRMVAVYEHLHIIDLSKLSNGYYTMRVTTPEGVAIRKVIRK